MNFTINGLVKTHVFCALMPENQWDGTNEASEVWVC